MTIIVGVVSPDGVVLAGDSRTTTVAGDRHRIASDNAQKLFGLCGRWAVATAGHAFIGRDTIAGLMDQFIAQLGDPGPQTIDEFTHELGTFFHERFIAEIPDWDPDTHGFPIDFLVAGYDDSGVGHIKEVLIPGPEDGGMDIETTGGGSMWRGQTDVIRRLIKGIDWDVVTGIAVPLTDEAKAQLMTLEYVPMSPLTVQDAVDYASFLVRTTVDMQRFSDGIFAKPGEIPGCGGPVQVVVVDRNGVQWVARPQLAAASAAGRAEGARV